MADKKKEERRNNFVIKGIGIEECERLMEKDTKELKEWVEKFIKEEIKVECKLETCRWSGRVIIGKVGSLVEKKIIMEKKHRLKGGISL